MPILADDGAKRIHNTCVCVFAVPLSKHIFAMGGQMIFSTLSDFGFPYLFLLQIHSHGHGSTNNKSTFSFECNEPFMVSFHFQLTG